MEPAGKIDIKSEAYRAAMPHVARLTKAALARYRELPKGEVAKNCLLVYFAVGFIVEGIAGALPAYAVSMVGLPGGIVSFIFFVFWAPMTWILISEEHAILSLAVVFIGATYITHLTQRNQQWYAALQGSQAQLAEPGAPTPHLIDATPMFTSGVAEAVEVEIIPPTVKF